MNGISFKCTSGDTLATAGLWGPWGNWYKCPGGFSGAKFKNEEIQVCFYLLLYAIIITLHNLLKNMLHFLYTICFVSDLTFWIFSEISEKICLYKAK